MVAAGQEQTRSNRPSCPARRALVVGLGRTGLAVVRYLVARGVDVCVTDRAANVELPQDLARVDRRDGSDLEAVLDGVDLVVPSPGVPASAPILVRAEERGVAIVSEIELAAASLEAPMIAVTGTNGKSTTTELIAQILGQSSARVFAGGNLGTPLIEALRGPWTAAVVEVSSFQLEWVESFHPRVGLLLNLTEDHLDRHGDIETYAAVKARLFARQTPEDVAILNRDDAIVASLTAGLRSTVVTFGRTRLVGDGAVLQGTDVRVSFRGRSSVVSLRKCRLLGEHNAENVMAAVLAAVAMGASDEDIMAGVESFEALAHRMQEVREHAGVRFVDDSKGTNVGALLRSIAGLPDGRVVLVAGGQDKGSDFEQARGLVSRKARCVVLYGSAREMLARSWNGAARLVSHESFEDAVRAAADAAEPGDVVILSPACASFDQFENYAQRGDAFASIVRALE